LRRVKNRTRGRGNPLDFGPIGERVLLVESRSLVAYRLRKWAITVCRRRSVPVRRLLIRLGGLHAPREEVAMSSNTYATPGVQGAVPTGLASRGWVFCAPPPDAASFALAGSRSGIPKAAPSRIFRFPLKTCAPGLNGFMFGRETVTSSSSRSEHYATDTSSRRNSSGTVFGDARGGPSHRCTPPCVP
jgi:hypothetical protein